jgi:vacuolar-type H+-ATPase subunit H
MIQFAPEGSRGQTRMSEELAAQNIITRLVKAEEQAREIVRGAEDQTRELLARATDEAKQLADSVRQEMVNLLQSRLREAEERGAEELKERLAQAEAKGREIERRANEHFTEAVAMVVNWIID